jgi:DNA-binding CsgD family transcriptional regulator
VDDDLGLSPSLGGGNEREGVDGPALWFSRDPTARLIVRRDLTVVAANQHALRLIGEHSALNLRDGVLTARDRKAASDLAIIVSEATSEIRARVVGAIGAAAVLAEAFALGADDEDPVALALRDLRASVKIDCADLEPVFGVTPGEHQMIVQLLKGYSSREIAEQFGKSILTVRTHVKRAYGKIGVKTRGQLFARLLPFLSIR